MEQLFCLTFQKTGGARFLSHLDMARVFLRAFRRVKLPLKYSEGFHAHPKVRFSPPLSVGVESLCEECFFTLLDEVRTEDTLLTLLSETMPDGFLLTSLTRLQQKPVPSTHTRYELTFSDCRAEALSAAFSPPMTVIKKTKSKELELDLFPHLLCEDIREKDTTAILQVLCPSGEALTINPTLLLTALNTKNQTLNCVRILKCACVNR